ncbi:MULTISPECIES: acyltransferase family protein [Acidobacteriaceae]|uniref:acyltransferase family protein n=1 Tax=Acidobacteriaceae TaxID=204434 RepID=UPI00131DA723|nr:MULTISPECIES: heparan-alpha-glucosaminide N-acetyltransferase domain-containing protein [Acidobacteriaceae]MDW5265846.1 heparan-alpha-glucosaminide N-acetyltransferase domain-containing protein [Edaphobacter sp.]
MSPGSETLHVAPKPSSRLLSIDVMRGITVGFMILVNNNGQNNLAYRAMNHSPWSGFTPTDLVFPTFLFIMGVSIVLSFGARKAQSTPKSELLLHILRRFVLLVLLGLVVNGFPYFHLHTLRIYGVLQRIAVCYLLASLLQLLTDRVAPRIALFVLALAGYWVLLRWVPVPGHGMPGREFPLLDPDINLVAYVDRHIFPHRLFEGTRDPEGLLSDIPSFASTLLGMIAGWWLKSVRPSFDKVKGLVISGVLLLTAGLVWAQSFPINKKLWTSSYVLYAGGWSALILAACYFALEIKQWKGRWTYPWVVFGTNAITAYVLSELLSSAVAVFHVNSNQSFQQFVYSGFFYYIGTPAFGSLVYSIVFAAICWIPAWLLYRKRIFIKL